MIEDSQLTPSGSSKKFYCSEEKFACISTYLRNNGWEEASKIGEQNDLIWTNLINVDFNAVGDSTFANHLKGSHHLSNKVRFSSETF